MNEKNYMNKVKDYIKNLDNPGLERDGMRAVKTLRTGKVKRSYEWIYIALTNKPKKNWLDWGFGLLFHKNYQKQIDLILEDDMSWDWFDEDAEAAGLADEVEEDLTNTFLIYLGNGKEYNVVHKDNVAKYADKIKVFPAQNKEAIEYLSALGVC